MRVGGKTQTAGGANTSNVNHRHLAGRDGGNCDMRHKEK